jgi:hypothetical protein
MMGDADQFDFQLPLHAKLTCCGVIAGLRLIQTPLGQQAFCWIRSGSTKHVCNFKDDDHDHAAADDDDADDDEDEDPWKWWPQGDPAAGRSQSGRASRI